MFPKMEMNWSRMPLGLGSRVRSKGMVCQAVHHIYLRRLTAHWTLRGVFVLVSVFACLTLTGTVFGEDKDSKLPPGACLAASSQSVLVHDKNVVSYVPKGSWAQQSPNIAVVNVEPFTSPPKSVTIMTDPSASINSCASNSSTGETVCTLNHPDKDNRDVYVISGTKIKSRLMSAATGMALFTGGLCTTCEVSMDPTRNRAVIGLNYNSMANGYQILNLDGPQFGNAHPSQAPDMGSGVNQISEGILLDSVRNQILSPNELNTFEIVKLGNSDNGDKNNNGDEDKKNNGTDKDKENPAFFENSPTTFSQFGSAAEDCVTGVALAAMASNPDSTDPTDQHSHVYLADLTQTKFTPGSPGTWGAPKSDDSDDKDKKGNDNSQPTQVQILWDSVLIGNYPHHGANGIAVAQDTHIGIVTGEWGADSITAFALPATSGSDTPAIKDWVTCRIPGGFMTGLDPHTVTAYRSPNTDDATGLVANFPGDILAWIDLKKMLELPRIEGTPGKGKHLCRDVFLPQPTVLRLIQVP